METTSMHIESLPDNLLLEILSYLPVKDRCVSGRVCRRWRKIVLDNSLWRHIDLLPYQLEPRRLWKLVKAHASDRLQVLRVRGVLDRKSTEVKPPLTEAMMHHLREACPNLWCFHMEPGNVTNIHTPVLPHSLTHLTLRSCTWRPQWLADCRRFLPHLVYLDLSDTVRVDNQDMKVPPVWVTLVMNVAGRGSTDRAAHTEAGQLLSAGSAPSVRVTGRGEGSDPADLPQPAGL